MQRNSLLTKALRLLFSSLFAVVVIFSANDAHAIFEGVRCVDDDCEEKAASNTYAADACVKKNLNFEKDKYSPIDGCKCVNKTISFDFFGSNNDIDWDLSNPTCTAYIASVGTALMVADVAATRIACKPLNPIGAAKIAAEEAVDLTPPPPVPFPSPTMAIRMAKRAGQCASRWSEWGTYNAACIATPGGPACPFVAIASADVSRCCGAVVAMAAANGAAVAALSVIWDLARIAYQNARICGSEWQSWKGKDNERIKIKGPYRECVESAFLGSNECGLTKTMSVSNKYYREFIFGGMEFEDNGEGACDNPTGVNLGYEGGKQKYYMTGPGAAPVYACHRFLAADRTNNSAQLAYNCCKKRSQNTMCIESKKGLGDIISDYSHKFCEIGSQCFVGDVSYDIYTSRKDPSYICAKTYSVCPYNHLLGGGTEEEKMIAGNPTQRDNFCQYMQHCVKVPITPYIRTTNFDGDFISSACRDMKGDSQNVYGYTAQLVPVNMKGFSAPMAQCFKETMENVFLHKAGDTKCTNPSELPSADGKCVSGYVYKKGETLPGESFFLKIQNKLQGVIKMGLVCAVMWYGIAMLIAVKNTEKKQLLPFVLKIALVMYFAVGDGWQFGFMKGVMGASTFLAEMTFKVDESGPAEKLDGCQFPRFNYADPTDYAHPAYPDTKSYLRIWDVLDCKIAAALGFGPNVAVPNLVMMILGGFLTGGAGIIFMVASFCFAFFLIAIAVRALHIFLISTTAVVILMYVSPLTITLSMFARTKGVFDKWWKELLGYTLQPMILFAYLGILITLFNKIMIGPDVTFTAGQDGDPDGKIVPKKIECTGESNDNSIYCIFRVADIKTWPGFEVLGIGLPMLASMNEAKLQTIIKAAFTMFIFMKFMDTISTIAGKLTASSALSSGSSLSMGKMASKSFGAMRAIQTRGMNAAKKHGGAVLRKGGEVAKSVAKDLGNKGKSVADAKAGGDHIRGPQGGDETVAPAPQGGDQAVTPPSEAPKESGGDRAETPVDSSGGDTTGNKT